MKTALQILEDALVYVTDGWRAGGGNSGVEQVEEAMARLKEAISTEISIPDWNDVPERTHEEVGAAITRAIRT